MASKTLAMKEVMNYTVSNYATGKPLFYVDYAGSSTLEFKAER